MAAASAAALIAMATPRIGRTLSLILPSTDLVRR
jgi:hypothetical protein